MSERNTPYPVVPGLTDTRRAEIQNMIADHRQKYPVRVIFPSLALTCICGLLANGTTFCAVKYNNSAE